jgi:hypothetical protein
MTVDTQETPDPLYFRSMKSSVRATILAAGLLLGAAMA